MLGPLTSLVVLLMPAGKTPVNNASQAQLPATHTTLPDQTALAPGDIPIGTGSSDGSNWP
jgi:hypothetical protein